MLWVDVEDLVCHALNNQRPGGIQRFTYEVSRALVDLLGSEVGFVRHNTKDDGFSIIQREQVDSLFRHMACAPLSDIHARPRPIRPLARGRLRVFLSKAPPEVIAPLGQAVRAQLAAIRAFGHSLKVCARVALGRSPSADAAALSRGVNLLSVARQGDVLCSFGGSWSPAYGHRIRLAKAKGGLQFALLLHDLISIYRPEFHVSGQAASFREFLRDVLPQADHLFAVSKQTARDLAKWALQNNVPSASSVVIPVGTERARVNPVALPSHLKPNGYVLLVSTLEPRKNHAMAFRIWQRLLEAMPRDRVPDLVFAGRVGWMSDDLIQAIDNTGWLDGKLKLIPQPDDATIMALYTHCRFTLFPSFYEGWGLPVSESLAFGKTCVASNAASVPEAGGEFCLYVDPYNVTAAFETVRNALLTPGLIEDLEDSIEAYYTPTPWSSTASAIVRSIKGLSLEGDGTVVPFNTVMHSKSAAAFVDRRTALRRRWPL